VGAKDVLKTASSLSERAIFSDLKGFQKQFCPEIGQIMRVTCLQKLCQKPLRFFSDSLLGVYHQQAKKSTVAM
jgi:hypothetical protein